PHRPGAPSPPLPGRFARRGPHHGPAYVHRIRPRPPAFSVRGGGAPGRRDRPDAALARGVGSAVLMGRPGAAKSPTDPAHFPATPGPGLDERGHPVVPTRPTPDPGRQ